MDYGGGFNSDDQVITLEKAVREYFWRSDNSCSQSAMTAVSAVYNTLVEGLRHAQSIMIINYNLHYKSNNVFLKVLSFSHFCLRGM